MRYLCVRAGKLGFQAVQLLERQLSTCQAHVDDAFKETARATGLDIDGMVRACGALAEAPGGEHYLDPRLNFSASSPSLAPESLKLEQTLAYVKVKNLTDTPHHPYLSWAPGAVSPNNTATESAFRYTSADCGSHTFGRDLQVDMALMQEVDLLVLVHGAAVGNIFFSRPHTSFLELRPCDQYFANEGESH